MASLLDPPDVPDEIVEFVVDDGFWQDVRCGPCERRGEESVVARLRYDYFERRWSLSSATWHTSETRSAVNLTCAACGSQLGPVTLTALLRRYRDGDRSLTLR